MFIVSSLPVLCTILLLLQIKSVHNIYIVPFVANQQQYFFATTTRQYSKNQRQRDKRQLFGFVTLSRCSENCCERPALLLRTGKDQQSPRILSTKCASSRKYASFSQSREEGSILYTVNHQEKQRNLYRYFLLRSSFASCIVVCRNHKCFYLSLSCLEVPVPIDIVGHNGSFH